MNQTLSLYKIFNTVARTENISHAAKELYISQPAISKAISHLENELNMPLFLRTSRGVHLTAEGELLYQHTKAAFEMIRLGEENVQKMHGLGIGEIHIGVTDTLCKYLLLPILKDFVQTYPHIKITIDCQSTAQTITLLEKHQLDLGLIIMPTYNKNLQFYPYMEIEDIFVSTKQYLSNLKKRYPDSKSTEELFRNANLMMLDKSNVTRQYLDQKLGLLGIETNAVLEVTNMDLLIEFAKIGIGIAGVEREFVTEELKSGELLELPTNFSIPKRMVCFTHHQHAPLSQAVQNFLNFMEIGERKANKTPISYSIH